MQHLVAEHNIIKAIVLSIQKAASETNRAFTNICDLNVSNQKHYQLIGKILLQIVLNNILGSHI